MCANVRKVYIRKGYVKRNQQVETACIGTEQENRRNAVCEWNHLDIDNVHNLESDSAKETIYKLSKKLT